MNDLISRQAAIDRINKQREHLRPDIYSRDKIGDAAYRICAELIERLPSAQPNRKKGKWTEKEVMNIEDSRAIEEWQSCRCSECGRYSTKPYLYYFDEPNFCSWCGADMRGEQDVRDQS